MSLKIVIPVVWLYTAHDEGRTFQNTQSNSHTFLELFLSASPAPGSVWGSEMNVTTAVVLKVLTIIYWEEMTEKQMNTIKGQ